MTNPIFVFGSNLAGRHGRGAAKWALDNRGAIYGKGFGFQGQSFAIPTKGYNLEVLPLEKIQGYINLFRGFAAIHPQMKFQLTPIGCGLAGYCREQIEPMFLGSPENVLWPPEWNK